MKSAVIRLPYLHDHHSHVSLYAAFEGIPDLTGLDREGALNLLRGLPEDRLNLVKGWRTDRLSLGARESPEMAQLPPTIIVNASLHGYRISERAMPFVDELWPELAEHAKHAKDKAWGERNLPRLFSFHGRVAGLDASKLRAFMLRMEALGLGSLEDMTLTGEEALSIESASPFAQRILSWATPDVFNGLSEPARGVCSGIKIFLDGSLGARSAALDAPFTDGTEGSLLYGDEDLSVLLAELAAYGKMLSIHAIGRLAIEQALCCLERAAGDGIEFPCVRLEHAQFISNRQARRCKEAGITLSMQPNFNADSGDYADRLIPRHRAENDPFRMLIDEQGFVPGRDLLFGSDGMPHGPEEGLRCCLFPEVEGQRLTPEEFEAGYGPARGRTGIGSVFSLESEVRTLRRIG